MSLATVIKTLLLDIREGEEPTVVELTRHNGVLDTTFGYRIKRGRREWAGIGWEDVEGAEKAARESARRNR